MRIALVCGISETVPPKTGSGREQMVCHLMDELARNGHEVTLFAAGGSRVPDFPGAELVSISDRTLREQELSEDLVRLYELKLMERLVSEAKRFDVIHNFLGVQALPFSTFTQTPFLTTHDDISPSRTVREFLSGYSRLPFVSITRYQRTACPVLNYLATIPFAVPLSQYEPSFSISYKKYLAFWGDFSPMRGAHHAVYVAMKTGMPLVLAGRIAPECRDYFHEKIAPYVDGKQIRYIGEINPSYRIRLMRKALATLMPAAWPELFDPVCIESLACGTPVLALKSGPVTEILENGKTGFITDSVEEMVQAVSRIPAINRRNCRYQVETHFSIEKAAAEYVKIYRMLSEQAASRQRQPVFGKNGSGAGRRIPPRHYVTRTWSKRRLPLNLSLYR